MARDFIYMLGDVEPFAKIFGGKFVKTTKSKECGENNCATHVVTCTDFNEGYKERKK